MSTYKARFSNAPEEISNSITGQSDQDYSSKEKFIPIDPQVKPRKQYAQRRSFDTAYKTRVLAAYDSCDNATERGALLRREGLHYPRIAAWRKQQANGKNRFMKGQKNAARIDHLIRENEQLKKKIAQAEAIIELQKKVSDLLGTHILSHENNEANS